MSVWVVIDEFIRFACHVFHRVDSYENCRDDQAYVKVLSVRGIHLFNRDPAGQMPLSPPDTAERRRQVELEVGT